jgi:hypothetical protein
MNLLNHTRFAASYTTMHDKAGREHLLVVVKATYRLPMGQEAAELLDEQVPIVPADTATGEPGLSAPEYESDFALTKPSCDVLLLGSAYAPGGRPCDKVGVGIVVGEMSKAFMVCGKRAWQAGIFGIAPGKPETFIRQPISYDIAFGGVERGPKKEEDRAAYLANPVGVGYHTHLRSAWVDGAPMPQTEELNKPVKWPDAKYQPMSFGPLGRSWRPRAQYAGTYDERWQRETYPLLPEDFDDRYFQAAPTDQQLPELRGGERVVLLNLTHPALTPSGRLDFDLPDLSLSVGFQFKCGQQEILPARADTLLLEPDKQRFSVTWRVAYDLYGDAFSIRRAAIWTPADIMPDGCWATPVRLPAEEQH